MQGVEHVLDDGRRLEAVAHHLERSGDGFAQAHAIGRREEDEARAELAHEALVLGHSVKEVGADREHESQGRERVIGHAGEARGEGAALVGLAVQGE